MFGIGTGELLVILVLAVLVIGPERMVEFAGQLGKWLAQFRQTTDTVTKDFREAFSLEAGEDEKGEEAAGAQQVTGGHEPAEAQPTSNPAQGGLVDQLRGSGMPPTQSEPASPEASPAPVLLDGEVEPDQETVPAGGSVGGEPVKVEVAELIPEDADVEPTVLEEVVLIAEDDAQSGTPSSEG